MYRVTVTYGSRFQRKMPHHANSRPALVPYIHRAPCVHGKVAVCREGRVEQHEVGVCRVFSAPTTSNGFLFTLEVYGQTSMEDTKER